ncbi:MAG: hypothetical protein IJB88_04400, partial [Clostridia bacterium]|nr:hypothetical protein [Clostridia bacterium]
MKRLISILLIATLLISALPSTTFAVWAEEFSALVESTGEYVEEENNNPYQGKVVSILGASTCTFDGYIPVADGFNLTHVARYPQDNLLTDVNDTWWMQVINALDAKLGINDSWRSTEVYNACTDEVNGDYDGTKACLSSLTRIQNLGSNGTPDIIFAFCGINDIIQGRPLSDFDSSAVPETVDLISETWTSVTDAYVAMIMRLQYFYPDAELVVLLPTYTNSYSDTRLAEYNAVYKTICEHFGVRCLDVRESLLGIEHMPDGIHPNAEGMTYLADFILDNILPNCEMEAGENIVYTVTHDLNNATASHSYYKGISAGKTFCETLSGENLTVTVTMGGKDITDSAYNNGEINIASVTDNIVINASAKFSLGDRLQHIPQNVCGGTNLWAILEPMNEYYTASGWGNNAAGTNYSVTFPIKAGDRLWATCFGTTAVNGFAANGA